MNSDFLLIPDISWVKNEVFYMKSILSALFVCKPDLNKKKID